MCAEPGARLPSPDAAATRSVCAKDLVELFGGDHHYIRDFPPEALADPPSNWNILAQRDAAQRVAGAAVLEIEDRPPTLPACVPSRITGRGVAVRGETGIRAVATHLLQQVLSDLDRQWPGRLFHLASRYRWLVDGALATGFRRLDTMAYLEHRLHRMTSLEPKHTLRSAQPEDLPQLAAIDARAFPNFWHMGAQRLNQLSQSESARLLVADADGQAAGFILTENRPDGRARPGLRSPRMRGIRPLHRQGVGTSLMAGAVNAMHGGRHDPGESQCPASATRTRCAFLSAPGIRGATPSLSGTGHCHRPTAHACAAAQARCPVIPVDRAQPSKASRHYEVAVRPDLAGAWCCCRPWCSWRGPSATCC